MVENYLYLIITFFYACAIIIGNVFIPFILNRFGLYMGRSETRRNKV